MPKYFRIHKKSHFSQLDNQHHILLFLLVYLILPHNRKSITFVSHHVNFLQLKMKVCSFYVLQNDKTAVHSSKMHSVHQCGSSVNLPDFLKFTIGIILVEVSGMNQLPNQIPLSILGTYAYLDASSSYLFFCKKPFINRVFIFRVK